MILLSLFVVLKEMVTIAHQCVIICIFAHNYVVSEAIRNT
jgi:hypothetical protein